MATMTKKKTKKKQQNNSSLPTLPRINSSEKNNNFLKIEAYNIYRKLYPLFPTVKMGT